MIVNGKDLSFGQQSAGLPFVKDGIEHLFQPVTFGRTAKAQIKGYTQTIVEAYIQTKAVKIANENNLVMSKTGERVWESYYVYFPSEIDLHPDDLFLFNNLQFRVIATEEWKEYGYNKYLVIQDYSKIYTERPLVL